MSDTEKAIYRAEGELANFLLFMKQKFALENRSQEYQQTFWHGLDFAMLAYVGKDK